MRVQIYQINHNRDVNNKKFLSLKDGQAADPSTYDEVFNAEIDEFDLEDIYRRFNTDGHPLHRGHSLSVSDVVVMNNKAYICQSVGFREIPFDVSLTQKPDNLMRVVYVEPNKPAYVAEVEHRLGAYDTICMTRSNKNAITDFKKSKNGILFASGSMWEGVDCVGDCLSSVIIVRLPFPMPSVHRQ